MNVAEKYSLSAELRLLCYCDLANDEQLADYIRVSGHNIDWELFGDLVSFNAMGGLVHGRLNGMACAVIPKFLSEYLVDRHRYHSLIQLAQVAETVRIFRLLDTAGMPCLILKGAAIAHLLYLPNTSWRYSSDIDLLVAPETFQEADRLLVAHGYRREWPEGEIPERGRNMLFHLLYAITYTHRESGLVVELHHRPTSNPFFLRSTLAETFAESTEITLPSGTIRTLDGALLIGFLAWHALGHHEYRVKWFSDFARAVLRTPAPARRTLLARCGELGAGRAVQLAIAITNILYGLEVCARPAFTSERKGLSDAQLANDVGRVLKALNRAEVHVPRTRNFTQHVADLSYLRFKARLSDDPRARAFEILRELSDPRDVLTLGLDRRWHALYALAGPLLAARRYLRHTTGI